MIRLSCEMYHVTQKRMRWGGGGGAINQLSRGNWGGGDVVGAMGLCIKY